MRSPFLYIDRIQLVDEKHFTTVIELKCNVLARVQRLLNMLKRAFILILLLTTQTSVLARQ